MTSATHATLPELVRHADLFDWSEAFTVGEKCNSCFMARMVHGPSGDGAPDLLLTFSMTFQRHNPTVRRFAMWDRGMQGWVVLGDRADLLRFLAFCDQVGVVLLPCAAAYLKERLG